MKVLVPIPRNKTNEQFNDEAVRDVTALLRQYGYEVEVQVIPASTTYITSLDTSQYSFICLPILFHAVWITESWFDIFSTSLPVIVTGIEKDNARTTDEPLGANIVLGSDWRKHKWVDGITPNKDLYFSTSTWTVKAGYESYVTALATDATTGDMTFWKKIGATDYTAPMYIQAGYPSTGLHHALPILMQAAINDGYIQPPPRKATSMWDIDDIPNLSNVQADVEAVIATQKQYSIPISWGLKLGIAGQGLGTDHWGPVTADTKAAIAAETPDKGGLLYTISHNHNWQWNMTVGGIDTKVKMDTEFQGDIARAQADGISMGWSADGHDMWGYCYPPVNRVSDEMFQLGSPQIDRLSSPANNTIQQGYGWKVIRLFTDSVSDGYGRSLYHNSGLHYHRDMLLLTGSFRLDNTVTQLTADSVTEITHFAVMFGKWFIEQMGFNQIYFMHGENFRSDGANNRPGLKYLDLVGQWSVYLKDVHEFIHPSDFATRKGII